MSRITSRIGLMVSVIALAHIWSMVLGLRPMPSGLSPLDTYPMAIGFTVGGVWITVYRWQRRATQASLPLADGDRLAAKKPSGIVTALRVGEYALAVLTSGAVIAGAAAVNNAAHHSAEGFLRGLGPALATILSFLLVSAAGLVYSQGVSAAVMRALNAALAQDWCVSRGWHYALLIPPFLFPAYVAYYAPSLIGGVVVHFVTLAVCWRYTDERPRTPLQALKLLRARRSREDARTPMAVTATARRGRPAGGPVGSGAQA